MKCLDNFSLSLILAVLTLLACIIRSSFLITVLIDTTQPDRYVDPNINILLSINVAAYLILALLTILLIYAIVRKLHKLMIPWLVAVTLSLIFELIFVIYILANGHSKDILFILFGTAISLWILYVIFMLYKAIRLENELKESENLYTFRAGIAALQVF